MPSVRLQARRAYDLLDGQLYACALPPNALPRIAVNFILRPCSTLHPQGT